MSIFNHLSVKMPVSLQGRTSSYDAWTSTQRLRVRAILVTEPCFYFFITTVVFLVPSIWLLFCRWLVPVFLLDYCVITPCIILPAFLNCLSFTTSFHELMNKLNQTEADWFNIGPAPRITWFANKKEVFWLPYKKLITVLLYLL
jgi:hypothetical protein